MATTMIPQVSGRCHYDQICPGSTPGTLGVNDRADPDADSFPGDTPGPAGFNDAGASLAAPAVASPPAAPQRNLTPLEFEALYHNLPVSYLNADGLAMTVTVDVHIYSNNGIPRRQGNLAEKDQLISLVRGELRQAGGLRMIDVDESDILQIAHAFFAKGSPQECALVFKHALRYGRTTPAGLQNYCDTVARIGLDCNGFVDNYFITRGRISGLRSIDQYARGRLRSSVDEIQALDVLIWSGGDGAVPEHIAVVDHRISGSDQMVVVESSGSKEGLVNNEYTVLEVRGRTFKVDRGPDAAGRKSVGQVIIAGV